MASGHRLIQATSHVTSFVGRVGVIGLCSCGWLGGEEGDDTRLAVRKLTEAWEAHARTEATTRVISGDADRAESSSGLRPPRFGASPMGSQLSGSAPTSP
jgi:hypothetical protein